jgi:hypothetical protein
MRWVIGLASALAVWRLWSRRRRAEVEVEVEPDPAEALRRKLAETQTDAEPEPPAEDAAAETIDERRARVHEKAQETIDSMHEGEA